MIVDEVDIPYQWVGHPSITEVIDETQEWCEWKKITHQSNQIMHKLIENLDEVTSEDFVCNLMRSSVRIQIRQGKKLADNTAESRLFISVCNLRMCIPLINCYHCDCSRKPKCYIMNFLPK